MIIWGNILFSLEQPLKKIVIDQKKGDSNGMLNFLMKKTNSIYLMGIGKKAKGTSTER